VRCPLGMGATFSNIQSDVETRNVGGEHSLNMAEGAADAGHVSGNIDKSRLTEYMQGLQRVARLQEEAMNAQIDARQKRREAGFKRQDVWTCDAEFMRQIQVLGAERKFEGMEDLLKQAERCQKARDSLGGPEQEGIEAEQRWEGRIWELQQAQERLIRDFQNEYRVANTYPPALPSAASSEYSTQSDAVKLLDEDSGTEDITAQIRPRESVASSSSLIFRPPEKEDFDPQGLNIVENSNLLGIGTTKITPPYAEAVEWESDSGIGDLDRPPDTSMDKNLVQSFQPLPNRQYHSIELYPQLLTDFTSTRDRISKWLENTALISRLESLSLFTILKDQLDRDSTALPSNWAQLVVAYWELDGATTPHSRLLESSETSSSDASGVAL
jgi:hypothetical protein